jgi:hypothetical protein
MKLSLHQENAENAQSHSYNTANDKQYALYVVHFDVVIVNLL